MSLGFPFLQPSSFLLLFHVCCNPVLQPEEIGFIDLSQIESQAARVDHVEKPAVAAEKSAAPWITVCCLGMRACQFVCWIQHPAYFFPPCSV